MYFGQMGYFMCMRTCVHITVNQNATLLYSEDTVSAITAMAPVTSLVFLSKWSSPLLSAHVFGTHPVAKVGNLFFPI